MIHDEKNELKKIVDDAASKLGEHFQSVRIFVTRNSEDGEPNTIAIDSGGGNFYAQIGQVRAWLDIQLQYQRNWAIRKDNEDKEE